MLNTVVVPVKHLNKTLRSLDLPLINCEIELDPSWLEDCIISEISMMLFNLLVILNQHELLMQRFK